MLLKVPDRENPYSVIGQYIRDHITIIEDIIATIELDGRITNELFMVDMEEDGYFVWKTDWYEGEQNAALIDFFPVSEAMAEREGDENENALIDRVLEIIDKVADDYEAMPTEIDVGREKAVMSFEKKDGMLAMASMIKLFVLALKGGEQE